MEVGQLPTAWNWVNVDEVIWKNSSSSAPLLPLPVLSQHVAQNLRQKLIHERMRSTVILKN